jgi:peptidyl-dipeptidase Dcp
MTNPLLADWETPFGIAPFAEISDEDFAPALQEALAAHLSEIDAIAGNPEPPSFANTIEAMEGAGKALDKVLGVFFNISGADSNEVRQALQRDFSPRLSAHSSAISSNAALFARIADLWDRRDTLGLSDEEARVLYLTHRGFVRAGAALEGDAADRMKAVKSRLAVLGTQFTQNLLKDESDWSMALSEADL